MADESIQFAIPAPPVRAEADLRAFQFKAVRFNGNGVHAATVDPTSGPAYILLTKPNSGQSVSLCAAGNVTKIFGGDTILAGQPLTFNASQYIVPASLAFYASSGACLVLGTAYASSTSGSIGSMLVR